jgi:hypothetical protein
MSQVNITFYGHIGIKEDSYESPLGARSLVDQNVTLNSPVTPDQTRDCFHTLFWKPLLSDLPTPNWQEQRCEDVDDDD